MHIKIYAFVEFVRCICMHK